MAVSDFECRFHNLEGESIREKRKSLYKLLQPIKDRLPEIQTTNYLEEIFRLEALLHCRKNEKIYEIFQTNNETFAKLIFKHDWVFLPDFYNENPDKLVNDILPKYSYSLRVKILNKISRNFTEKDEEKFDTIFDYVFERYGQEMAVRYLPRCSQLKIKRFLSNTEVTLTPTQLKLIFNKSPDLLTFYVDHTKNNSLTDGSLFVHIAQKNPQFCIKLYHDFEHRRLPKLGKRTTKTFMDANQDAVRENIKKYSCILNNSVMVRKLQNFEQLLHNFFPSKVEDLRNRSFKDNIMTLVKCCPKNRRWDIFCKAFFKAFNATVEDNLDFIPVEYLELLPKDKKNILNEWADNKYEKNNDDQLLKYSEPSKAFKILREKINFTSNMSDRQNLLVLLVNNATYNENSEYLEKVLEYYSARHRNEHVMNRSMILNEIADNVNFDKINEKHWKPILELLEIEKVKEGQISERSFNRIYKKYLEFLYRHNLKNQKVLEEFVTECVKLESYQMHAPIRIHTTDAKIEYNILCDLLDILPKIKDTLYYQESPTRFLIKCLENITDFNKCNTDLKILAPQLEIFKDANEIGNCPQIHHQAGKIALFTAILEYNNNNANKIFILPENEKFIDFINNILTSEEKIKNDEYINLQKTFRKLEEILGKMLFKTNRSEFENQLLDIYFSKKVLMKNNYGFTNNIKKWIEYFLTNDPQVIANHFDSIFSVINPKDIDYQLIKMIKSYSHLNLDVRLINFYKSAFLADSNSLSKLEVLKVLSILMPTDEYLKFVEKYIPKDIKLDLNNSEQKKLWAVQCDIVKSLKYVSDFKQAIPFIMKFSQGDYLQASLPTLYKAFAKLSELDVEIYLDQLALRAMSAKKHVLFLSCKLLPIFNVEKVYIKMASCQNSSIMKHWFGSLINYFSKNPTENLLIIALENFKKINKNDSELLSLITGEIKIPSKYKERYSEKMLTYLDELQIEDSKYYNSVLNSINTENMEKLSQNFCKKLIKNYFLTNPHLNSEMNIFVTNYLLTYPKKKQFSFVFKKLQDYKKSYFNNWSDPHKAADLSNFFITVYTELPYYGLEFVAMFKKYWEELFTEIEDFRNHLMLKWMHFYKEDPNIEIFASKIDDAIKQLESMLGFYLFELIKDSIYSFINYIPKEEHFDLMLKRQLLSMPSRTNYLLAVSTLENQRQNDSPLYDEILDILKKVDDSVLQVKLNDMIFRN